MGDKDLNTMILQTILENQTKMADDISGIRVDISKNTSDLERNTDDLAEHMRRTDALERLHENNETRIEKLEFPIKVIEWLRARALWIAGFIGAVVTITKIISTYL